MTAFTPATPGVRELITSIRLPAGFEVSWAGAAPAGDGFCFGSEDGRWQMTGFDGERHGTSQTVAKSGEAINGIAFAPPWIAVSTRNEVTVIEDPPSLNGQQITDLIIPHGAHEVVLGLEGRFYVPIGQKGLLRCVPTVIAGRSDVGVERYQIGLYFYTVSSLQTAAGVEVVCCAIRQDGILSAQFGGGKLNHKSSKHSFNGLDVVSTCALRPGQRSAAAGALGIDGTLILFRDVLSASPPTALRYEAMTGTAYRMLSARGFLFVLTSYALYAIGDLIEPVIHGETNVRVTPFLEEPMEAVDAYLAGDRWLLIVLPDEVLRLDIEMLEEMKQTSNRRDLVPERLDPVWTTTSGSLMASGV